LRTFKSHTLQFSVIFQHKLKHLAYTSATSQTWNFGGCHWLPTYLAKIFNVQAPLRHKPDTAVASANENCKGSSIQWNPRYTSRQPAASCRNCTQGEK